MIRLWIPAEFIWIRPRDGSKLAFTHDGDHKWSMYVNSIWSAGENKVTNIIKLDIDWKHLEKYVSYPKLSESSVSFNVEYWKWNKKNNIELLRIENAQTCFYLILFVPLHCSLLVLPSLLFCFCFLFPFVPTSIHNESTICIQPQPFE